MDVLFSTISTDDILYLPTKIPYLPRIGEHVSVGSIESEVVDIEHFYGDTCYIYYAGDTARKNGVESKWGVNCKIKTQIIIRTIGTHSTEDYVSSGGWEVDPEHITWYRM